MSLLDQKLDTMPAGQPAATLGVDAAGLPVLFATWRMLEKSHSPVAATADTNEDTLATITVPANAVGPNGVVRVKTYWLVNNNANSKIGRVRAGGAGGTAYWSANIVSTLDCIHILEIANDNSTALQKGFFGTTSIGGLGFSGGVAPTSAVDTTADWTIVITGQKATAGDTLALTGYEVEVFYAL